MIYIITAINSTKYNNGSTLATRTWGYYETLDQAIEAVEGNYGDMYENEYNYIVIEEATPGICSCGMDDWAERWFVWSDLYKRYYEYDKPEWSKQIIGWVIE